MDDLARLQLDTLFAFDSGGRIISTREPQPTAGPLFILIRSASACAWAVRADVPTAAARTLDRLAREEPPAVDFHAPPVHAGEYQALLGGQARSGPVFRFPDPAGVAEGGRSDDIQLVEDEQLLRRHFTGWVPGEIRAGRAPVAAVMEDGHPVSICFCARRSGLAAEAGLETAAGYRGRGFGPRAAAAWARRIRAEGLIPLYSTSWTNTASLAVARKLGLTAAAADWSISD